MADLTTALAAFAGLGSTRVPDLRRLARILGRDQALAEALRESGEGHVRLLACFLAEPARRSRAIMDRWAADFHSWWIAQGTSSARWIASDALRELRQKASVIPPPSQ